MGLREGEPSVKRGCHAVLLWCCALRPDVAHHGPRCADGASVAAECVDRRFEDSSDQMVMCQRVQVSGSAGSQLSITGTHGKRIGRAAAAPVRVSPSPPTHRVPDLAPRVTQIKLAGLAVCNPRML